MDLKAGLYNFVKMDKYKAYCAKRNSRIHTKRNDCLYEYSNTISYPRVLFGDAHFRYYNTLDSNKDVRTTIQNVFLATEDIKSIIVVSVC